MENPTLVMVPCFSGAPWNLSLMTELKDWPMKTMKLPDDLDNLEGLADFVASQVKELDSYYLIGDSFGAAISLALATRNPQGLRKRIVSSVLKPLKLCSKAYPTPLNKFYQEQAICSDFLTQHFTQDTSKSF